MPKMIKLTSNDGETLWVNAGEVAMIDPQTPDFTKDRTATSAIRLSGGDGPWYVRETPEEILALIEVPEPEYVRAQFVAWAERELAKAEPLADATTEAFLALKRQDGSAETIRDYVKPCIGEERAWKAIGARRALGYLGLEALLDEEE